MEVTVENLYQHLTMEGIIIIAGVLITIVSTLIIFFCLICKRSNPTKDVEACQTMDQTMNQTTKMDRTVISPIINNTFSQSILNNTIPFIQVFEDDNGVSISM